MRALISYHQTERILSKPEIEAARAGEQITALDGMVKVHYTPSTKRWAVLYLETRRQQVMQLLGITRVDLQNRETLAMRETR